MSFKLFGREPVLWLSLISSVVMFVSAFLFPLTVDQQGMLNAASVALFSLLSAFAVETDKVAPAILGLLKAILALSISFGLGLSPDKQSMIMVLASAVVAMFLRTQVTAPVTATAAKKSLE